MSVSHPAKFSEEILTLLKTLVKPDDLVCDVFGGTGLIHKLDARTVSLELEPEWAAMGKPAIVGNALQLPFPSETFDLVITSPVYGNRASDHHNAKDKSKRITYTHMLGRPLSAASSAGMHWGKKYRDFHITAWQEVWRVTRSGFVLNVSNHLKKEDEIRVMEWHLNTIISHGFDLSELHVVKTPRMKFGANRDARVEQEFVAVFAKKA